MGWYQRRVHGDQHEYHRFNTPFTHPQQSTMKVSYVAIVLALAMISGAQAQVTIIGTGSLSWNAGIFPGGVLPLIGQVVSLTTNAQVSVDTDVSIAGLTVNGGATASINIAAEQTFATSGDTEVNSGILFVNASGSYECDGDMLIEAGQNAVADLVIGAKATVTVGGDFAMDAGANLAFEAENKANEAQSGVTAIAVEGMATFEGTLEVVLNDFVPSADVTLMTYASYMGEFASVEVVASGSVSTRRLLEDYEVEYREGSLVMTAGAAGIAATSTAVLALAAALVALVSSN